MVSQIFGRSRNQSPLNFTDISLTTTVSVEGVWNLANEVVGDGRSQLAQAQSQSKENEKRKDTPLRLLSPTTSFLLANTATMRRFATRAGGMSSCRLAATPAFARPAQWARTLTDGPHKHLVPLLSPFAAPFFSLFMN
jgi:hypothetical protein